MNDRSISPLPTCLFTGEVLTASTRFEHTIPKSVGGRIKSRTVSSDRFNNAAGNKIDKKLAEASADVMEQIGKRMLSSQQQPLSDDAEALFDLHPFDMNAEIAAVKSILLTADHLLSADPRRFTRSEALSAVRNLVGDYVLKGHLNARVYNQTILGMQYEKLDELLRIRQSIKKPITSFEHVMVISADPAAQSIDAIWWLASVDPYGFRLSSSWLGEPFTLVVISSFLETIETSIHQISANLYCELSGHERTRRDFYTTSQQSESMRKEMASYHRQAWRRAARHAARDRDGTS